jgi:predicted ester cyclase
MSSAENNKVVVRRFIEEFYNRGNMDVADELLAPDFVSRDTLTGEEASIEGYKREIAEQAAVSSDLHFSIEEQIAEGDKVVTRTIGSGTHDLAEYEGLAPSGVRITIENIDIDRVVEGRSWKSGA